MKLTMLAVEAATDMSTPNGLPFRWSAHHVREGVLALLPRGLDVDGSSKIQITCAPGRARSRQYWQALGASEYVVEDVDFGRLAGLPSRERDICLLGLIEGALIDLAGRHHRGHAVETAIREACEALRRQDFRLDLPVPRLAKSSRDRTARARVVRCLNRDAGEAWRVEITTNSGAEPDIRWMTERPHYLDMRDVFARSEWAQGRFIVRDRLGRITYEAD